MGSGHFLVEACRFLGEKLYEACRLCDELALKAEQQAESSEDEETRKLAFQRAKIFRQRAIDLPDPDDKLMKYLPSAAPEGEETGFSQAEAIALCRRLVAVHCLYGVDKNPLAVELAKLSLWLESHAEGLPLTFLDHRLVLGDSLTGPFFEHLLTYPGGKQDRVDDVFAQNLRQMNGYFKKIANVKHLITL
uniref:site-specific DNA-methyltransferase (adenine-specific) n=2 Tax=Cyanophyceae TaxID=3028117 RepID=A0A0C1MWL1_9CYAN